MKKRRKILHKIHAKNIKLLLCHFFQDPLKYITEGKERTLHACITCRRNYKAIFYCRRFSGENMKLFPGFFSRLTRHGNNNNKFTEKVLGSFLEYTCSSIFSILVTSGGKGTRLFALLRFRRGQMRSAGWPHIYERTSSGRASFK